jgi:hypothetical protein
LLLDDGLTVFPLQASKNFLVSNERTSLKGGWWALGNAYTDLKATMCGPDKHLCLASPLLKLPPPPPCLTIHSCPPQPPIAIPVAPRPSTSTDHVGPQRQVRGYDDPSSLLLQLACFLSFIIRCFVLPRSASCLRLVIGALVSILIVLCW